MEKTQENNNENQIIKIIPPTQKGIHFPDNFKWITISPKPHKLNETILTLEIEELEKSVKKVKDELSLLRKRKHKDINPIQVENKSEDPKKIQKINEIINDDDQPPPKKYQKKKRICPCCNTVVIRHFCPHSACEKNCPIKIAYLKKKMKMEALANKK